MLLELETRGRSTPENQKQAGLVSNLILSVFGESKTDELSIYIEHVRRKHEESRVTTSVLTTV